MNKTNKTGLIVFILLLGAILVQAGNQPELKLNKVTENLFFLSGAGGNIGVLKARDKLLLVDTGIPRTGKLVKAKLSEFFKLPVQLLVITHHHQDHTGAIPLLGAGRKVILHRNCLTLLKKIQTKPKKGEKPAGKDNCHYLTYEDVKRFSFGDEMVTLRHFGSGHTSGDTVVIFENKKVVHTGDLFFQGMAPYIDVKNGADTLNWVALIKKLAREFPDFRVIPGHGDLSDMKGYLRFAQYLNYLRKSVQDAINQGKTLQQAQESITFGQFKDIKDMSQFISKKNNVGWVYQELNRKK